MIEDRPPTDTDPADPLVAAVVAAHEAEYGETPPFGGVPGATDGTILWLSGPRTIETVIAPAMTAAADKAGRPAPRIVASVPICVTDDADKVRGLVAGVLANYNDLPSYRGA